VDSKDSSRDGKAPSFGQSLRGIYNRCRQRLLNFVASSTNLCSTPILNFTRVNFWRIRSMQLVFLVSAAGSYIVPVSPHCNLLPSRGLLGSAACRVWSGIFDLLAALRMRHLHLPPFPSPLKQTPLRLFTFSPSLLPPPPDWQHSNISVVGPLLLHQALPRNGLHPQSLPPADAEVIVQTVGTTKARGAAEPAPLNLPQAMEVAQHSTSLPHSLTTFLESGVFQMASYITSCPAFTLLGALWGAPK
jgi:hypothetical protein